MLVASFHFESNNIEETLVVLITEKQDFSGFEFTFSELPVMQPLYVKQMEEKWGQQEIPVGFGGIDEVYAWTVLNKHKK